MNQLKKAYKIVEKYMPILTIVFFLLGIWIASESISFCKLVKSGMSGLCDVYQYIAPIAIYVILTPSLGKMLLAKKSNGGKFVGHIT